MFLGIYWDSESEREREKTRERASESKLAKLCFDIDELWLSPVCVAVAYPVPYIAYQVYDVLCA